MRFFVKRICILYIVFLIVFFLSKNQRIPMILVLTFGVLFSILRFWLLESVLKQVVGRGKKSLAIIANMMVYLFSLVVVGGIVVIAIRIGIYTVIAALVGTLSIPIIIMINTITEALGITKNQYGQKVK